MSYYNNYQNSNSTNSSYSSYLPVDTTFSNYNTGNGYSNGYIGGNQKTNKKTNVHSTTTNPYPYVIRGRIFAFIALCLILVLFIGSIVSYTNSQPCSQYVTATIANVCGPTACCTSDGNGYTCNMQLNYMVNGVNYTNIPLTVHGSTQYMSGQTVTICYSSDDAKQISLRGNDSTGIDIAFITISSILLVLFGYLQYKVFVDDKTANAVGEPEGAPFFSLNGIYFF